LFVAKKKKKNENTLVPSPSSLQTFKKNERRKQKKMQIREGAYISFPTSAFGMKHSSCLFLSMFLQH
jgi:hypothetical protein